jgi:hypothetical protein
VGYAFVDLATSTEAQRAITELSGKEVLARKVSVQLARRPETAAEKAEHAAANGESENRRRGSGRGRGGRGRGRGGRAARGGRVSAKREFQIQPLLIQIRGVPRLARLRRRFL